MFNQCTLREKCVWWQNQCFDLKILVTDYFTYYISDYGRDLPEARDVIMMPHSVLADSNRSREIHGFITLPHLGPPPKQGGINPGGGKK